MSLYYIRAMIALGPALALAGPAWHALAPAEFEARGEPQARIDLADFDRGLMNAAIFHETNRVRQRLGLPLFTHLPKLDEAADLKAAVGVTQDELTHDNPLPMTATLVDRVSAVGLRYRMAAENLARLGVFDLPRGSTHVGVRQRKGQPEFFHLDSKRPVVNRTYAGFAEAVVESWMNSPPHRANIVNAAFTSLGCATRPTVSRLNRHEQIYAVQVFFTPR